jgi:SAM-dependent methyltransferase
MATDLPHDAPDLSRIYAQRFAANQAYRRKIWGVLIKDFFGKMVPAQGSVLDLGCGYGEFINGVVAARKHAMDLNPDAAQYLASGIDFLCQDCSQPWPVADSSLDAVFTSNFFEHLPDKATLGRTLDRVRAALKPGGVLIAMGPNIKHVPGAYWDFWDHYLPLSELSLGEALENRGFDVIKSVDRFLPYTMARGPQPPPLLLRLYLRLSWVWPLFGRQFLVIARK